MHLNKDFSWRKMNEQKFLNFLFHCNFIVVCRKEPDGSWQSAMFEKRNERRGAKLKLKLEFSRLNTKDPKLLKRNQNVIYIMLAFRIRTV